MMDVLRSSSSHESRRAASLRELGSAIWIIPEHDRVLNTLRALVGK
jgi:hypothetical protein